MAAMITTIHFYVYISKNVELKSRESIPYQRLYWFGQRYDIFRISVNTSVPFQVYRYFLYL